MAKNHLGKTGALITWVIAWAQAGTATHEEMTADVNGWVLNSAYRAECKGKKHLASPATIKILHDSGPLFHDQNCGKTVVNLSRSSSQPCWWISFSIRWWMLSEPCWWMFSEPTDEYLCNTPMNIFSTRWWIYYWLADKHHLTPLMKRTPLLARLYASHFASASPNSLGDADAKSTERNNVLAYI